MLTKQIMGNKCPTFLRTAGDAREFVCRSLATVVYTRHRRGGQ